MNKLLAIEWLKIKRYRTFWILVGLFVLLLPLWNYEIAAGNLNIGGKKNGINVINTDYSFPQVWSSLGFWGSMFINFFAILVIIVTTNEYSYRSSRQNVIDGWSKMQFYHAKILFVFTLSFLSTLFLFIVGLVFGGIYSGSLSKLFSGFEQLGYFFLLSLDYLGFALFIALLIRRSGLSIGLFLLYSMIIENILRVVINLHTDKPYGNLLLLQSSDELLPFPINPMMNAMIKSGPSISTTTFALVAAGWCGVYYLAGRMLLLRKDW